MLGRNTYLGRVLARISGRTSTVRKPSRRWSGFLQCTNAGCASRLEMFLPLLVCSLSLCAGTIKKSLDMGKTWTRELHVTPPGLTPHEGGSYDYSCLVPSPLKDDATMGGLLWSHNSAQGRCAKNPAPPHCWLALFSRFPLDF